MLADAKEHNQAARNFLRTKYPGLTRQSLRKHSDFGPATVIWCSSGFGCLSFFSLALGDMSWHDNKSREQTKPTSVTQPI